MPPCLRKTLAGCELRAVSNKLFFNSASVALEIQRNPQPPLPTFSYAPLPPSVCFGAGDFSRNLRDCLSILPLSPKGSGEGDSKAPATFPSFSDAPISPDVGLEQGPSPWTGGIVFRSCWGSGRRLDVRRLPLYWRDRLSGLAGSGCSVLWQPGGSTGNKIFRFFIYQ